MKLENETNQLRHQFEIENELTRKEIEERFQKEIEELKETQKMRMKEEEDVHLKKMKLAEGRYEEALRGLLKIFLRFFFEIRDSEKLAESETLTQSSIEERFQQTDLLINQIKSNHEEEKERLVCQHQEDIRILNVCWMLPFI